MTMQPPRTRSGICIFRRGGSSKDGLGNLILQTADGLTFASIANILLSGRQNWPVSVQSGNFTPAVNNSVYYCSATLTAAPPTAVGIGGAWYIFVNTGTGVVTIDPFGLQLVGSRTTWRLEPDSAICIQSDGANWVVVWGRNENRGSVLPTTGLYTNLRYDYIIGGYAIPVQYDGTRWLGPEQSLLPTYGIQSTISKDWSPTGGAIQTLYFKPTNDFAFYLTRFELSYVVEGTHNSSNYWKIRLWRYERGVGWNQIDNDNWTTDKTTANDDVNFAKTSTDFSSNPLGINHNYVRIDIINVGTPAAIGFSGVGLYGRKIYT
jgi:hypothetical protein